MTGWQLGLLLNIGCTISILLDAIFLNIGETLPSGNLLPLYIGSALTLAAFLFSRNRMVGQLILGSGAVTLFVLGRDYLLLQPMLSYLLIIAFSLASLFVLAPRGSPDWIDSPEKRAENFLKMLSLAALCNWLIVFMLEEAQGLSSLYAAFASTFFCVLGFLRVRKRKKMALTWWDRLLYLFLVVVFIAVSFGLTHWLRAISSLGVILPLLGLYVSSRRSLQTLLHNSFEVLFNHSEGAVVLCFFFLCGIGSLVLALPFSTARKLDFIDVAFTAISAVCITGLAVVDISLDFSLAGRILILVLIQLGGLGIMSFSSLAFYLFGKGLSLRHEAALSSVYGQRIKGEMKRVLRTVFILTFIFEGVGAVLLWLAFWSKGMDVGTAAWNGLFTSISAFCNAGFSLQSENFIAYQKDPIVLLLTSFLVIIGGLSPAFFLSAYQARKTRLYSLQDRIVVVVTFFLLLLGSVFFMALEWDKVMSGLDSFDKFANSFFFSAISRTAGFSSFNVGDLYPATQFILLFFMFVGGSPGGTAGGIKTTCFAVIAATVYHAVRGNPDVVILRRRINNATVSRAIAVFFISLAFVCLATLSLLVTQNLAVIESLFEVVSAFATVGLTMNVTPRLDSVGKFIIMACMFVGRVGPLGILLYLSERREQARARLATEEITVA